jgi:hypothetical protein
LFCRSSKWVITQKQKFSLVEGQCSLGLQRLQGERRVHNNGFRIHDRCVSAIENVPRKELNYEYSSLPESKDVHRKKNIKI